MMRVAPRTALPAGAQATAPSATPPPLSPPYGALAASNRIPWRNGHWYLHDVNVPWCNWGCDFGCGAHGGMSDPVVHAQLDAAFRQARTGGMRVLRLWLFPGDPWQIARAEDGGQRAVNPAVYPNLDVALQLAEVHHRYYKFILFSAPSHLPPFWLWNATQREQLASV